MSACGPIYAAHTLTRRLVQVISSLGQDGAQHLHVDPQREKHSPFLFFDFFFSPLLPTVGKALFVVSSPDSDAAPQFQGTLQAWRVAAAAIIGEKQLCA